MKALMDLHVHTIACGHAYSTVKENIFEAKAKGLKVLGISEHGYGLKGLSRTFFLNLKVIPREIEGIRLLKGIEANIIDYDGNIFEEEILERLDYAIASLHIPCIKPGTKEENTRAVIGAIRNKNVNIIGHLDDSRYPIDYEEITDALKEENVILEVNNSSMNSYSYRQNARESYIDLLKVAKKKEIKIIMSTDAHFYEDVGAFPHSLSVIEEVGYPKDLIVNYNLDLLKDNLRCEL